MEAITRSTPVWLQRPGLRKLVKYSMVSLVSVVVSQVVQLATFFLTHNGVLSSIVAVGAGTIPSYALNRRWTWRRRGPSHLWREIVPFWVLSFVGLVFSTFCVYLAESWAEGRGYSAPRIGLLNNLASLGAFGVLWVGKFLVINRLLFHKDHLGIDEAELPPF